MLDREIAELDAELAGSLSVIHRAQAERALRHEQPTAIKPFRADDETHCYICGNLLTDDLYYDEMNRPYCGDCIW